MTHRTGRNGIWRTTAALVVGALCSGGPFGLFARDIQVGRYASIQAAPTEEQADLLSNLVTVAFPAHVRTVGGAVQHVLSGSGYRLAAETASDPVRADLLGLPLPDAHRSLGPMPLRDALETLGGPAFRLVEDPLHRLVSFERCPSSGRFSSNPHHPHRR